MISLVNGNGERVNNINFLDWEEAEDYLHKQKDNGADNLYLYGEFLPCGSNRVHFVVVGFDDGYSMVIKAAYYPTPNEIVSWIKSDMDSMGYTDIFEYYETDSYDVYAGYDTDNIDNWPIFGA